MTSSSCTQGKARNLWRKICLCLLAEKNLAFLWVKTLRWRKYGNEYVIIYQLSGNCLDKQYVIKLENTLWYFGFKIWNQLQAFSYLASLALVKGLPWRLSSKELACQYRRFRFDPWVRKIPWRRKWQPTPALLPRKSHGQRSLVDYSPWVEMSRTHPAAKPPPTTLVSYFLFSECSFEMFNWSIEKLLSH